MRHGCRHRNRAARTRLPCATSVCVGQDARSVTASRVQGLAPASHRSRRVGPGYRAKASMPRRVAVPRARSCSAAGSRSARSCSSRCSTTARSRRTSTRAASSRSGRQVVQQLRPTRRGSSTGSARSTSIATLAREARALGYVRPGERLYIVKGINQWRKQRAGQHDGPPWTLTDARSSPARSDASRARSAASSCAARSAARRSPSRARTTPTASRSRRRTTSRAATSSPRSRGSRRRAASSAGRRRASDDPALAASRAQADDEQRALRRELAAGETGRDGGASLELGVGGAGRTGSLKCLHAHAAFALARPGYELGERIVAELDPLWPDRCCTRPWLASARHVAARHDARPRRSGRTATAASRASASDRRRYERSARAGRDRRSTSCASRSARPTRSPSSRPPIATRSAGRARRSRSARPRRAGRATSPSCSRPRSTPTSAARVGLPVVIEPLRAGAGARRRRARSGCSPSLAAAVVLFGARDRARRGAQGQSEAEFHRYNHENHRPVDRLWCKKRKIWPDSRG